MDCAVFNYTLKTKYFYNVRYKKCIKEINYKKIISVYFVK
jgi:hypothetical protein